MYCLVKAEQHKRIVHLNSMWHYFTRVIVNIALRDILEGKLFGS